MIGKCYQQNCSLGKGFICMITGCSLEDMGSLNYFFLIPSRYFILKTFFSWEKKTLEMFYDIETQYGKFVHCPFRDHVFSKSVMSFPS